LRNLKNRVSKLEDQIGQKLGIPVLIVQPGETVEEVKERNLREHPEHRERKAFLCVRTLPPMEANGGPPPRPGSEQPPSPPLKGVSTDKPLQITR
jgi:hypothetical protein